MENSAQSLYSDAVKVYFNYDNFCLDFLSKEDGTISFLGRVKLSPQSSKELKKALDSNIKRYESIYGKINNFDEKAKDKEEVARKEILETQNQKLESECDRLQRLVNEKAEKLSALQKELQD